MIKNLISRLTMVRLDRKPATEIFSHRTLHYYQDYYFHIYLAESPWGYRMRIK